MYSPATTASEAFAPGTQTVDELELHVDAYEHAWCVLRVIAGYDLMQAVPELHVSFCIPIRSEPDCTLLAMHPLFAYTHLDHAPISCDIAYAPSARTILDRATREPIPASVLDEPATEPPLSTQLILRSSLFPWDVVVRPHAAAAPAPASPRSRCPRRRRKITNLDVLYALQDTLSARVTQDEWAGLGARARRRISHAYETRCIARGGGWGAGVRRIDWLGGA